MKAFQNQDEAGAAAVDYLRVIGHLCFAYFWARMARIALARIDADGAKVDPFYIAKLSTARFYFQRLLPETAYHIRRRPLGREERDGARGGAVLRQPTTNDGERNE